MISKTYFYDHFFFFVLVFLVLIIGYTSYYRFMIKNDYIVGYEGVCDPATNKCFIGCEDDACTKESYYSKVEKYAPDLYRECGKDITDCEAASKCLPNDRKCSVTYCNTEVGGDICKMPTDKLNIQNTNQTEPTKEDLLQSNNINNTNI